MRCTPEEVVLSIQSRLETESKAMDKTLHGEELTASDNVALSPLEHFVLGGSSLSRPEGTRMVAAWFDDRDAKDGSTEGFAGSRLNARKSTRHGQ
jgi:hypothetical protein